MRCIHVKPTEHEVYTLADGEAAIDFLRRKGRHSDAPKIDLLVLDINMPKRTGHEVSEDIKADPELRSIPVVMLTSSTQDRDVSRAYDAHGNCYLQKPNDWWSEIVQVIENFWCSRVTLPRSR